MDKIFINQLKVDTVIGIFEWERRIRQTLFLDLELANDCATAAQVDRVEQTVDYKALSKRITAFMRNSEFQLIETLAEQTAELIRTEFAVPWVRLRLHKPAALREAQDVGVEIERGRLP